jgi:DNA-binding transcriptional ArsR family regulator
MSKANAAGPLAAAHVRDAAPLFAALGDATRLRLLARLSAHGPASIAGLRARADVTRQAVTKHLAVLARAGLVRDERRGRERIWRLESRRLGEAQAHLDRISRAWDDALERLRDLVEDRP